MPAVPTTGSVNIQSLNSKITADLCGGNFLVDVSPSEFINGGQNNVQGASVQITNPVGVIFKPYETSGFDIEPPMTAVVSVAIPLIASNYQYGTYIVDVRLTDEGGTIYTVTKSVNICPPDPNNKTRKTGCMEATISGNCDTGKVIISLKGTPNYKGVVALSQVNALEVDYPAGSTPFTTTFGSFSMVLYEGWWQVTGTVCALYLYGDNVYFKVQYKVKCEKTIRCAIDECCVQAKLEELRLKVKSDCTQAEKDSTFSTLVEGVALLELAKITANCGSDPSDIIDDLEKLLGCQCTCNCNDETPIINNAPVTDYRIEGCNVSETIVGLTKTYTINNYSYKSQLGAGSDAGLTVSAPILNADNCQYYQEIVYTAPTIPTAIVTFKYRGIVTQASTGIPTATVDSTNNTVTVAYTRIGVGSYVGTVSGTFTPLTQNNMFILFGKTANVLIKATWINANSFSIVSADAATATPADGLIDHVPFELSIF